MVVYHSLHFLRTLHSQVCSGYHRALSQKLFMDSGMALDDHNNAGTSIIISVTFIFYIMPVTTVY